MVEVGEILGGRYAILSLLGSSPRGTAYQAENLLMGSRVVVKVLSRQAPELLEQARLCSRLDHPSIARVLDVSPTLDPPFVVCEQVAGLPFTSAALAAERPAHLEYWTIAVDLTLQVLGALEYAHRHGLVHGAIHPNNVLIRYPRPGVPWATITDFRGDSQQGPLDEVGAGSPFLAPELRAGGRPSEPSDVFAAAALLRSSLEAAARVPPQLERALDAALNADPALRPGGAEQLAGTLAPFLCAPRSGAQGAPWSRAPNILFTASEPPPISIGGAGDGPVSSAGSPRLVSNRRDSRVTDSLLRNPHFLHPTERAQSPPAGRLWRFVALGLGVGLLATFALTWLVAR